MASQFRAQELHESVNPLVTRINILQGAGMNIQDMAT